MADVSYGSTGFLRQMQTRPEPGRHCGCCGQPCAYVERPGQSGAAPCLCSEPSWGAALGFAAMHFQDHWMPVCHPPGPILGTCCVSKQTGMVLRYNWWGLEVQIISYCSISKHRLDPCVVVCLQKLAVCQAHSLCFLRCPVRVLCQWVGLLLEACAINIL